MPYLNMNKKETPKMAGAPIKLICHWRRQPYISLHFSTLNLTPWTKRETHAAITTKPEKIRRNDNDNNKYIGRKEKRRDDSLMLATIHDDSWNVLNMQHEMIRNP